MCELQGNLWGRFIQEIPKHVSVLCKKFCLVLRKGFHPNDYITSWNIFNKTSLLTKKATWKWKASQILTADMRKEPGGICITISTITHINSETNSPLPIINVACKYMR